MVMLRGLRLAIGAAVAWGLLALALTVATAEQARPCDVVEPDSLGISWMAPCDEGRWLLDPQSGCRIWDWHPAPEEPAFLEELARLPGISRLRWAPEGRARGSR